MSQCKQILAVLSDGCEHEMRDIHREVGFCRLNSRVAELRKRGHRISCRRDGFSYFYKLEAAVPPSHGLVRTPASSNPTSLEAAVVHGRDGDAGVLTLFGGAA